MHKNFIEELRWRGMLHDMMPGTEEQLTKEMTTAYIGFDPTASSLHIGNLATIMLLKHFQLCGHKPIALVGGATGMIGDPSFKAAERSFLSEETLRFNQEGIRKQLSKFLDFDCGDNSAELVNNYDWFKNFSFLEFLREAGKYLSVNYMMSKDSVKKRLETGISFTEFSYQLLQGYDFYWLYKNNGVRLQMGGSDQWGNITTGTEIIRRKEGGSEEVEFNRAFALTTPLVTKADGTKFGKSESGNVWLDASMTSPYEFYQFWLNAADADSHRLLRVFTLLSREEITAIEEEHAAAPHLRIMQKALAKDVTCRVHSEEAYNIAVKASEILYGKGTVDALQGMSDQDILSVFAGVPQTIITRGDYEACTNITDLVSTVTNGEVYASKGEARRAIQGNALSVNKSKVSDPNHPIDFTLLNNKYLLLGKGKKNHLLIVE
ncbi:tyrosine--tRNA ligase [Flectobacillus sp. BAB-3569]|uniref:tyrosine--tRNA ligase n=1 Tax=Flectobacillus sp. BAB-3569 TaxID=1509483 RepID=UPI000BA39E45|nr:tyrosine--tRNA ligase [Flectobacillus sp. BAB-3569]PAC27528.1 tyrosine--tRNA ligase [Flectobacillus sp. BAB-3569]